ncbi:MULTISPECIES: hypothetical protein [unclassified Microcoleus]|uniref:hypothetical protein n=1 Tax=unclassified Microcoleus TaxID=2642155 RepID=UPI002FD352DD
MSLTRAIPELGQLVKVRSRQYVVTEIRPADIRTIQSPFRSGIDTAFSRDSC